MVLKQEAENIMSDIKLIHVKATLPDIDYIIRYSTELYYLFELDPVFIQVVSALNMWGDAAPISCDKVNIHTLGVLLFWAEHTEAAIPYFEWSALIDEGYHQAYNRLGDCYMTLLANGAEKGEVNLELLDMGLRHFRTAVFYCDHGTIDKEPHSIPINNYKADNLMRLGLCLMRIKRYDDAKTLALYAEQISDHRFIGYSQFGYESWKQLLDSIPDVE